MSSAANKQSDSSDGTAQAVHQLNVCGLSCPEPLMLLHREIRRLRRGELLRLCATDPSTQRDVERFCHHLGHQLLSASQPSQQRDRKLYFLIRKGGPAASHS